VGVLEEGPREALGRLVEGTPPKRGRRVRGVSSVRATLQGRAHPLEGGRALVTNPQPVRFKFKHADVGASDLE
jgi:hypothetical protein